MLISIRNPFFPTDIRKPFGIDMTEMLSSLWREARSEMVSGELLSESRFFLKAHRKTRSPRKGTCSAFTFENGGGPLSEELVSVPPGNNSFAPFATWKLDLFKTRIERGTSPHQPSLIPHCLSTQPLRVHTLSPVLVCGVSNICLSRTWLMYWCKPFILFSLFSSVVW